MSGSVSSLITQWVRGWALSREVPPPQRIPGGFRLDVGLPGHRVRHVLHTWNDETLRSVSAQAGPGTWIKVAGSRADLHRTLPGRWTVDAPGYLMSTAFSASPAPIPPGYRLTVTSGGTVVTARALDAGGAVAATAHLARTGSVCVVDRVETLPQHRRRGLGSAVMRALSRYALGTGMTTGVLVATDDGQGLYRSLGWTTRAEIAAAFLPECHPAPLPESHPAPLPESHPAPLPESHPAPLPESRPAALPESRPAPLPESHPAT